jgi:hypothetical protein
VKIFNLSPKKMVTVETQSEEGPGEYTHSSTTYISHNMGRGVSLGLHIVPENIERDQMCLGPVARAVYHTLETVDAIPRDHCFVMLHFIQDGGFNVDVTMLPVGDESARSQLDSQLKAGREGFESTLFEAINMCVSDKKVDNVSLLYNSMGDIVSNQSKIAIVHELGTSVDPNVVKPFLNVSGSMK